MESEELPVLAAVVRISLPPELMARYVMARPFARTTCSGNRLLHVIPNAGDDPNVVPEYPRVWYCVRDTNRGAVEENYEWILDIAAGAAEMTRTEPEVFLITGVHTYTLIRPLQEAMQANLERVAWDGGLGQGRAGGGGGR